MVVWEVEEPSNLPEELHAQDILPVPDSHYTEAFLEKTRPGGCLRVLWENGGGATFTCLATGACRYLLIPPYRGPFQDWARALAPAQIRAALEAFLPPSAGCSGLFPSPSGGKPCRAEVGCHHSVDSSL